MRMTASEEAEKIYHEFLKIVSLPDTAKLVSIEACQHMIDAYANVWCNISATEARSCMYSNKQCGHYMQVKKIIQEMQHVN